MKLEVVQVCGLLLVQFFWQCITFAQGILCRHNETGSRARFGPFILLCVCNSCTDYCIWLIIETAYGSFQSCLLDLYRDIVIYLQILCVCYLLEKINAHRRAIMCRIQAYQLQNAPWCWMSSKLSTFCFPLGVAWYRETLMKRAWIQIRPIHNKK